MKEQGNDHYYIEKNHEILVELPYVEEIRTEDNKRYLYQSTKHIGLLRYFMADAEQLTDEIEQIKKPNRKELIKLAEDYHNKVCDGTKCIIYEKKLPPIKVTAQLVYGTTHIFSSYQNETGTTFQQYMPTYGLMLHFWLPYINEKLFLKTGIIGLSNLNFENSFQIFKIPLQIEYLYPKGIIRPRLSAGFDFIVSTPTLSGGFNIEISKKLSLSIDYDIDFTSGVLGVNPDKLLSHSLYTGLNLKF